MNFDEDDIISIGTSESYDSSSVETINTELSGLKVSDQTCDKCKEGVHSCYEAVCKQCLLHLCAEHVQAHINDRFTCTHTLIPRDSEELAEIAQKLLEHQAIIRNVKTCEVHSPELAALYCKNCTCVVCQSCFFTMEHKDHEFVAVQEYAKDAVASAQKAIAPVIEECRTHIHAKNKALVTMQKNLESARDEATCKLNNLFKIMKEQMDAQAKGLESLFESRLQKLTDSSSKYQDLTLKLQDCSSRYHALDKSNPFEVIRVVDEIDRDIKAVMKLRNGIDDHSDAKDTVLIWKDNFDVKVVALKPKFEIKTFWDDSGMLELVLTCSTDPIAPIDLPNDLNVTLYDDEGGPIAEIPWNDVEWIENEFNLGDIYSEDIPMYCDVFDDDGALLTSYWF